jgi:hypothetical protein
MKACARQERFADLDGYPFEPHYVDLPISTAAHPHAPPRRGPPAAGSCCCSCDRRGLPLPQDIPVLRRGRPALDRSGPRGVRPLRQAADRTDYTLRAPCQVARAPRVRRARPARRHAGLRRLGRPPRPAARGRHPTAPGSWRPARSCPPVTAIRGGVPAWQFSREVRRSRPAPSSAAAAAPTCRPRSSLPTAPFTTGRSRRGPAVPLLRAHHPDDPASAASRRLAGAPGRSTSRSCVPSATAIPSPPATTSTCRRIRHERPARTTIVGGASSGGRGGDLRGLGVLRHRHAAG